MKVFDNSAFTEKCLTQYAQMLRTRLTRVKFMLNDGNAVKSAISGRVFRVVQDYTPWGFSFPLDEHMRGDGSIEEDTLAEAVASGLAEPLINAAGLELQAEENDPIKRIGAGQLWVLHEVIPEPQTLGAAHVHFAKDDQIGLFGQLSYDKKALKNMITARAVWALARSGETVKEPLNVNVFDR